MKIPANFIYKPEFEIIKKQIFIELKKMRYREGRGVVETGPFLKSSEASITVFMRVRQFEPHLKKSLQKLAIIQERFDRDFY